MVLLSQLLQEHEYLENKLLFKRIGPFQDFKLEKLEAFNPGSADKWCYEEIISWYTHHIGTMVEDEIEYRDLSVFSLNSKELNTNIKKLPTPEDCNFRELAKFDYKENVFTTFHEFSEQIMPTFYDYEKRKYKEKAMELASKYELFSRDIESISQNLMVARLRVSYLGMLKESYARDMIILHPKFEWREYILWELDSYGDRQLKIDYFIQKVKEKEWVFLGITGEKDEARLPKNCDVLLKCGSSYKDDSFNLIETGYFPTRESIDKVLTDIINY